VVPIPDNAPRYEAVDDVHPRTGASTMIFYADRGLETFGSAALAGFGGLRRRGLAPFRAGPLGPPLTSLPAYRQAMTAPAPAYDHVIKNSRA